MPIHLYLLNPTRMLVGGQALNIVKLEPRTYALGRNPRVNDIVFPDASGISRQHCTFGWEAREERFYLWNKSSTGVFLGEDATPVGEDEGIPLDTTVKIQLGLGGKKGANLVFEIDNGGEAFPDTYHNIAPDERSILQNLLLGAPKPAKAPTKIAVFLSYGRVDHVLVNAISLLLKSGLGGQYEILMDSNLTPGRSWSDELEQMLGQARVVIVVLSSESSKSKFVREEIVYAQKHGKHVIPILIDGDDGILPLGLNSVQYVDLRPDFEKAIQRVVDSINKHVGLQ